MIDFLLTLASNLFRSMYDTLSHLPLFQLQEEWDDSTLSSDTLRVRIQNRLEASTRRERALAYAFSQQVI